MQKCPFCSPADGDITAENDLAYARFDVYPVNRGHMLIIPFRHTASYFALSFEERAAVLDLVDRCREIADERYSPDGYNIGVNVGEAAGQSVMHVHFHFIPRYCGDVESARGGIRAVIPEQRDYPFKPD
ncbi:MAG TPA: HIT family protein [Methanoculleus sp.]|nr:HIT family protein [Methanoculleus sp.]